jgi:hypothetical protein
VPFRVLSHDISANVDQEARSEMLAIHSQDPDLKFLGKMELGFCEETDRLVFFEDVQLKLLLVVDSIPQPSFNHT